MGRKPKDLTGMRFGHLVAVEMLEKGDPRCRETKGSGSRQWLCECDCGKKHVVFAKELTAGHTKSCGCQKYVRRVYTNFKKKGVDLTGKRFGHLTVMCKAPKEFRPSITYVWLCMCDCGNETYSSTQHLMHGFKRTCGVNCEYHRRRGEAI